MIEIEDKLPIYWDRVTGQFYYIQIVDDVEIKKYLYPGVPKRS